MEENKESVVESNEETPTKVHLGLKEEEVVKITSKKATYLIVVLLICVFLLLGLVVYLFANQGNQNTKSTVISTKSSSISSVSSVTSSDNSSVSEISSSTNSSKTPYYTYSTNVGKYVSFDYPTGGKITITSNREDKMFTKATDISGIQIVKDTLTFGSTTGDSGDICTEYTYDVSKPNVVTYQGPTLAADGTKLTNIKSGTWDISSDKVVIVNKDGGYVLIASDKMTDSKFLMFDNYDIKTGVRTNDGIYKNDCSSRLVAPKTLTSTIIGHRAYCTVTGSTLGVQSFTEAKKCVEALDRFITSFKVK